MREMCNRKGKHKRLCMMIGLFLMIVSTAFFFFTEIGYAASDDEIIKVLVENDDLFDKNNIFTSAVRSLGWILVKALATLADACETLFDNSFQFVDFTQYDQVQNFITTFKPWFIALVCLSLIFLGVILISYHEKKPKIAVNILLAVLVVSSGTYLISQMNKMLDSEIRTGITGTSNTEKNDGGTTIVSKMVGSSITDLRYLDDKLKGGLMSVTQDNRLNLDNLKKKELNLIDINEIVKPDDVSTDSKDLMGKRLVYSYSSGDGKTDYLLDDLYDGVAWTDLMNEYYYRYQVSWIQCIIGLLALIIVYLCLAYKVIRILYEIVIHQLLAYLYSANLADNQKVVKILVSIKDSYITLLLALICVRVYSLAYTFINNMTGLGGITKAFFLLFIALAVVDGPNIIQKLTGVDAGLSSGFGKMIAGAQAMRMAGASIRSVGHWGSKAVSAAESARDSRNATAELVNEQQSSDTEVMGGMEADADVSADTTGNPHAEPDTDSGLEQSQNMQDSINGMDDIQKSEIPEGSGFSEDASGDTAEGKALTEPFEDMNASNIGRDPLTGEPNGQDVFSQMENDLGGGKPINDSGLGTGQPVEYGGKLFDMEKENYHTTDIHSSSEEKNTIPTGSYQSVQREPGRKKEPLDRTDLER